MRLRLVVTEMCRFEPVLCPAVSKRMVRLLYYPLPLVKCNRQALLDGLITPAAPSSTESTVVPLGPIG